MGSHQVKKQRPQAGCESTPHDTGPLFIPRRIIQYSIQAIADFLVEDRCVICAQSHRWSAPQSVSPAGCLGRPARHPVVGGFTIENHPLCAACAAELEIARRPSCLGQSLGDGTVLTIAGERFGAEPVSRAYGGGVYTDTQPISLIAPFMITDNVLKIIHLVKFSRYLALLPNVGAAVASAYAIFRQQEDDEQPVVVPTPMEAIELRKRGFNQATELARVVAHQLGFPLDVGSLVKTRRTSRQSTTEHGKRADNVRGAFSCRGRGLQGRSVVLIDDLVTTGATAASCIREILGVGARSAEVVCFARAL
ncbi:MAG: hypothetical protein OEN01_01235 [Candidatus Krumholzibacteria bacterium]|nr:hypothetical protein [Candidatus Krumholzibacteria bacterium]